MPRAVVACACLLACLPSAVAQAFVERLEAAQAKADDGQWEAALDILVPLQQVVELAEDLEVLATRLLAIGDALAENGGFEQALRARTAGLALLSRLHAGRDVGVVATATNDVAVCYYMLGRVREALPHFEAALAMRQRLYAGDDHEDVATSLNYLGYCLGPLGRDNEALPHLEAALAMRQRLHGEHDHVDVAFSLNNVAYCRRTLGRESEALPQFEAALAMLRRLYGDGDRPDVATVLRSVAVSLQALGRSSEALQRYQEALAMWRGLAGGQDQPEVATTMYGVASCLESLGRGSEALAMHEAALAMAQRLYGKVDHRDVAQCLGGVAQCLHRLGRSAEALSAYESALAMTQRLVGEGDHPDAALYMGNIAACLQALGRDREALSSYEASLAMLRRAYGERDHPAVAGAISNVAHHLSQLGRAAEALPLSEAALAMRQRVYGDRDHPDVAGNLNNVAACLADLGRPAEALPRYEMALAMNRRVYGESDHFDVLLGLSNVGACLDLLGRASEALPFVEQSMAMIERIRGKTHASPELRQSFFDGLKRVGAFERFQRLATQLGRPADALRAAERGRGRDLLDRLVQSGGIEATVRSAISSRDEGKAARFSELSSELDDTRAQSDRLLHELTTLADGPDGAGREQRRAALLVQANSVHLKLRQLHDERARLLGDLLPVGSVREAADIQTVIGDDEALLEFTVTNDVALVFVLGPEGAVEALPLPKAYSAAQDLLPSILARSSRAALVQRGRDPEAKDGAGDAVQRSRELFASLVPAAVWERIRGRKRVFVAAHRALHRLPFELLVTDVKDGVPAYWLDHGPAVAYVPSGSVLHWLRTRQRSGEASALDVLAVGDPKLGAAPGESGPGTDAARFVPPDELERIRALPQLRGARAEAEAIVAAFRGTDRKAALLLGAEAIEPTVFRLAGTAKYLHFACHGIAEEYAGQSLSMLLLAQPESPGPGDDGLLKLRDLFDAWTGRLEGCRLVTLSACRTNVGPTQRDEAPHALPLGFLYAGARAVISSLWAVDDASTQELMADFYRRLLAGQTDQLAAFTAAKQALRAKHPDPFHWAPFLYIGVPE